MCIIHVAHFFRIFSHVSILHNPTYSIINSLLFLLLIYYYYYYLSIIIIINPLSLQLMLKRFREGKTYTSGG
jgi:hypothetical protein